MCLHCYNSYCRCNCCDSLKIDFRFAIYVGLFIYNKFCGIFTIYNHFNVNSLLYLPFNANSLRYF